METESVANSYNAWSGSYDEDRNATRDMEARALRELLADVNPARALEAGCGTGKNTIWLAEQSNELICMDISEGMLARAREKVSHTNVTFVHGDLTRAWGANSDSFNLVVFSLVLEHIPEFTHVFAEAFRCLKPGGLMYVGELHPFKQYQGSKARFETGAGLHTIECYTHHISEYLDAATGRGFHLTRLREFFDDDGTTPRILAVTFRKPF